MRHADRIFEVEGREVTLSIHAVDRYRERTGDFLARELPGRMATATWAHRRPSWDDGVPLAPGLHFVGCVMLDEDSAFPCALRPDKRGGTFILAGTYLHRRPQG